MKLRGGAILAKALKKYGVDTIFSLPGHQILSVFDACIDEKITLISTRHELSAIYMAEGMSYATQEMGVVLLAGGPELTDALTGLAKAYYANTPLLVISGTNPVAKLDKGFPQDMDQMTIVKPFTKWCKACYDGRRIPEYLHAAYRHALRGRPGPVYLEIPYDILEEEVKRKDIVFPEKPPRVRSCGDEESLEMTLRLTQEAKKPILIAGSGVFWSQAEDELQEFVEKSGIPLFITTAASAMRFPSELVAGLGTPAGGRYSLRAITQADLVILLGTRINFMLGFGQAPFFSSKQKIIQIDIEPSEIGQHRDVDVGVVGDIKEILAHLNPRLAERNDLATWQDYLKKERESFQKELLNLSSTNDTPLHPMRLVKAMEEQRKSDSTLILDGANSALWAILGVEPRSEGQIIFSPIGDLEAIGAGVPHAIALKLGNPDKQVILHTGDGSFGFCIMEYETAVRYKIPFVAVVHNDCAWGMTRDMQIEFFGKDRQIGNELNLVRYDLVVQALGGHGEFVENPADLEPALKRALGSGLPACVNVVVDPKPKSPGLVMWTLMEIMLGKKTYYDKLPQIIKKLEAWHLSGFVRPLILKHMEGQMHKDMK
ncbi:thiamine pyrophosphate-binding protein [Acidobacteriota bacterium]